MTYTSLSAVKTTAGSIRRWVNYAPLDVDQVIEEAQALIFQTLRVREMRTEFDDLSMAVGDYYKALPTGFLDPIALKDKTNNLTLKLYPEQNIIDWRTYESGTIVNSIPYRYSIFGERLQFEAGYESVATLSLVGYKAPAFVASGTETNFIVTRYPHLMRVACLAQAYDFMSNKSKRDDNLSMLTALIEKTNAESDLTYRGVNLDVGIA
jgi:hypothetical protein